MPSFVILALVSCSAIHDRNSIVLWVWLRIRTGVRVSGRPLAMGVLEAL